MNELTLSSLLGILKRSVVYIIIVAFLFAGGAYCFCKFIATPTYQAKASFIATNGGIYSEDVDASQSSGTSLTDSTESKISNTDYAASRNMLNTYIGLFKTRGLYTMLKEKTGLEYSAAQLKSMVQVVRRADDALFIDFTVTCTNKQHAILIADTIYEIGDEFIASKIPSAYVMGVEDSGSKAYQNYPVTFITVVVSAIVGGILVFIIAFTINILDKTIKGEKDFSANYDIPILGNIPNFKAAAREEKN